MAIKYNRQMTYDEAEQIKANYNEQDEKYLKSLVASWVLGVKTENLDYSGLLCYGRNIKGVADKISKSKGSKRIKTILEKKVDQETTIEQIVQENPTQPKQLELFTQPKQLELF